MSGDRGFLKIFGPEGGIRLLTEDEIKKIKEGVVIITLQDVLTTLSAGRIKIIKPTLLSCGYRVGYSIERIGPDLDVHHISVSNSKGITDPAEAECIANDFLGDGYKSIGSMNLKNVLHFMKFVKKEVNGRK